MYSPFMLYSQIDVWSRDASVTEGGAAGGTKQSRVTKNRSNYSEIGQPCHSFMII